jgi:LicD family
VGQQDSADNGFSWQALSVPEITTEALEKSASSWRRGDRFRRYGKQFLRSFYESSTEAGMRPFLMWGTLLGCVREGRFLRHDYDIDVGILADDYANKDRLVAAMRKRGYELASLEWSDDYLRRVRRWPLQSVVFSSGCLR